MFATTLPITMGEGVTPPTFAEAQTVKEYVYEYFLDIPIMAHVAKCESEFRHYGGDGNIIRGKVNRSDIGVMQINEYYHGKTAGKLEIDLYTLEGNLEYARWLYEKEGTVPWASSSPCWNKDNHLALR